MVSCRRRRDLVSKAVHKSCALATSYNDPLQIDLLPNANSLILIGQVSTAIIVKVVRLCLAGCRAIKVLRASLGCQIAIIAGILGHLDGAV